MKDIINISNMLKNLGISANLSGYYYIRDAVMLMLNDVSSINKLTKIIYPCVAKTWCTTKAQVERGIRTAIEKAWIKGDVEFQNELFGFSVDPNKGRPTNSEFLATVADYIRTMEEIV